jgi:NADPH2 dehydrogenase
MSQSRLFQPIQIGQLKLEHRIGMAPLTRFRAADNRVPTPMMHTYYTQRAAVSGTLIITEGTFASANCGAWPNSPGIWREDQIASWKPIVDEVHEKGCFIYCQLFAMGRAADVEVSEREGVEIVAPSAIPISADQAMPRAMTVEEINVTIQDFVESSKNAILAGFDGVEINSANGYLLDQFLQDVSNQRQDDYGGNVENRSRFLNDLLSAVGKAIGAERVGLRLSPWSTFQGMRMADPIPQFTDIISKANRLNIAYLHLVESRVSGSEDASCHDGLDFAYNLWNGPLLVAGGYTPETARKLVEVEYPKKEIMVMFGRYFLSNPDLVFRIAKDLELNGYMREKFYSGGAVGYSDYPFSTEYISQLGGEE